MEVGVEEEAVVEKEEGTAIFVGGFVFSSHFLLFRTHTVTHSLTHLPTHSLALSLSRSLFVTG